MKHIFLSAWLTPVSHWTHKQRDLPYWLIVSGIGSLTENLSEFIDSHLQPLVKQLPCYLRDTTYFFLINYKSLKDIFIYLPMFTYKTSKNLAYMLVRSMSCMTTQKHTYKVVFNVGIAHHVLLYYKKIHVFFHKRSIPY